MPQKLSRSLIKKYPSITYNDAIQLGITDEDLKYISEIAPNKFRASVPNPFGKRLTKVEHSIIDAIHTKYDFLKKVTDEKIRLNEQNESVSKNKITKFSKVSEGIQLYLNERAKDLDKGFIQEATYSLDIDCSKNAYLIASKIFNDLIIDVDENRAQDLTNYFYDLKGTNGKKLSTNTIYKPFSFMHKVFNYFKNDLKIITYNPFDNVKNKPHAISNEKTYLTEEEMHYIHDRVEFENIRFRTLIVLLLDSGIRREEALALKFENINKNRNTASIKSAVIKLKGKLIVKSTKTKASEREIILTNNSIDLINKYRQFKTACGFVVKDDDFIFTAWDSMDLIDPNRYSAEFKKFIKRIGIKKDIPLKNLRTTNATFFVANAKNLKAVQKHEGHSSFETTMKFYAQSNLDEERKLVDIYEQKFYNKLGLSMADLYRIISDRFNDDKKLISVLEKVTNEYIDSNNFDIQLECCKSYFKELFPIFDKIQKIDNLLTDDEIEAIFKGFTSLYLNIKIEPFSPSLKI